MKSIDIKNKILLLVAILFSSLLIFSCGKDDEGEEEIDTTKIELLSFGPSPALRGGELIFIGRNLDQVSSIVLPDNVSVTSFDSKTADKISLTIPEATVEGYVVLKTPQGDITTKSQLSISEPITIASFSPTEVRPGESITITGTYLNLIQEVIFNNKKSVMKTDFVGQSQNSLEVTVPGDAQTGAFSISNGMAEPIIITSDLELVVTLPVIESINPSPVKAGAMLTVTGSDLDLVKELVFGGNKSVVEFISQSVDKIEVVVPSDAQDATLKAIVASSVEVFSADMVILTVPTISEVTPNPAKPGTDITLKGTDLDLVTSVVFGGDVTGTVVSQSEDELVVTLPLEAIDALVTVNTAANKSVQSSSMLNLVIPAIEGITPIETQSNNDITISGTNLDLVVDITFGGGQTVTPTEITETSITVTVPSGTEDGPIIMNTTNGSLITSAESLTILASNVPVITGYPAIARPGDMITLTGDKLDLHTDVIFPGDIIATQFGMKTAEMMEVVVPLDVTRGVGVITFVTFEGETSTSPPINFQGVDPVQDESLVFFDFNGTGAKDSWWGAVQIVNDENTLDGSSYGMISGSFNGWTDLFWRNSQNNFPGPTIGTDVENYVLKFDLNVLEPITGGNIKFRLQGTEGDFWWAYGPAAPPSAGIPEVVEVTNGWTTITVEFTAFKDGWGWGENSPTDLNAVNDSFGMAFDNGDSNVQILIDNVRFERK